MKSGVFTSKKGITYHYSVSESGYIEMWKRVTVGKRTGGYKQKDIMVKPTKEAIEHLSEVLNMKVWSY